MELAAFVSRVKISTLVNGMNSVCIQGDGMKDQIEWTVFECKLKKKKHFQTEWNIQLMIVYREKISKRLLVCSRRYQRYS